MSAQTRWLVSLTALVVLAGAPHRTIAQVEIQNNFKYNSGQDVQPIFEGWSKTSDGSFRFHFGYLNRNYVQALSIPVGPANSIEPGGPDRGQPTFFAVRTNRNLFTVTVPKDWGKKDLVWTITANGKTQKAFGWLQPEWEIDPAGGAASGGQTDKELLNNKAPTIAVAAPSAVTLPSTLTLNATVTDDGIPKPRAPRKPAVGQETPPTLQGFPDAPVNVPQVAGIGRQPGGGAGRGQVRGPTVTWMIWRGPAGAEFEPRVSQVKDDKAQTTVTFTTPGDYIIRGRASDRILSTDSDIKVTVAR
jgi:hypothetical protein